jgi:hypothetical protein
MTEQDLINLEFEKITITNEESQNGYDYCYYSKTLLPEFTINGITIGETLNRWVVYSNDPDFTIKNVKTLKELIDVFSKIKNAEREASISKENG